MNIKTLSTAELDLFRLIADVYVQYLIKNEPAKKIPQNTTRTNGSRTAKISKHFVEIKKNN